ncbi:unnamed protein product, partial [Protopolystoma xenopodis]
VTGGFDTSSSTYCQTPCEDDDDVDCDDNNGKANETNHFVMSGIAQPDYLHSSFPANHPFPASSPSVLPYLAHVGAPVSSTNAVVNTSPSIITKTGSNISTVMANSITKTIGHPLNARQFRGSPPPLHHHIPSGLSFAASRSPPPPPAPPPPANGVLLRSLDGLSGRSGDAPPPIVTFTHPSFDSTPKPDVAWLGLKSRDSKELSSGPTKSGDQRAVTMRRNEDEKDEEEDEERLSLDEGLSVAYPGHHHHQHKARGAFNPEKVCNNGVECMEMPIAWPEAALYSCYAGSAEDSRTHFPGGSEEQKKKPSCDFFQVVSAMRCYKTLPVLLTIGTSTVRTIKKPAYDDFKPS